MNATPYYTKQGRDLDVGDTIKVWSSSHGTIVEIVPYTGPLARYFRHGARMARFLSGDVSLGATIDNSESYDVVVDRT